ncbi:phage baseplate assembly protein V [Snodgrassella sp. CFCC 13594]|uniref:phage baseplate assembly protein V n=1 Tax=Snodgrassella sp. CFCC 13594 TaxID=1775559 RepID=UPI0009EF05F7|nr:phage baseplate assembly protein V [Snodgrassella sp. CFCC 13594]
MNPIAKLAKKTKAVVNDASDAIRQAFRGKLTLVNSGENVQRAQVSGLADETLQDIEHMQQFGFTSNPPPGTEVVVIPLGGATSHGIIVATENGSYRVKSLASGEVSVYNQDGASITLKKGRIIDIDCEKLNIKAPSGVDIDAPNVNCTQEVTAAGQINGNGGLAIQGGSGASFNGNIAQSGGSYTTDGDVTASGISLHGHDHVAGVGKPV